MKLFPIRFLLLFFLVSVSRSQEATLDEWDLKIISEGMERSHAMKNLEYLCDMIGPRLTGSEQMKMANEWTAERFKDYGLKNVRLEPWKLSSAWSRGLATARILEPVQFNLIVAQQAWTPATQGTRKGEVVLFIPDRLEDLQNYSGKIKGAWLLLGEPAKLPSVPLEERGLRLVEGGPQAAASEDTLRARRDAFWRAHRDTLNRFWSNERITGIIRDAGKRHALLTMTGSPINSGGMFGGDTTPDLVPRVFMIHEHYALLYRFLTKGEEVQVEMNLQSTTKEGPFDSYNTVAEIPGSEKPEEIVSVGAHLDSWDLAQGTTDDGTGSMGVLEAARILSTVGAKPKRTIRFILYSGEEQGHFGSRAYVVRHLNEMQKTSVHLQVDLGAGKVRGIALLGNEAAKPILDNLLAPFHSLGVYDVSLRHIGGSDHMSFDRVGVPGFFLIQDPLEYGKTHHSQSDTFDYASEEDLKQASVVLAALALKIANLPDLLPRKSTLPPPPSRGK